MSQAASPMAGMEPRRPVQNAVRAPSLCRSLAGHPLVLYGDVESGSRRAPTRAGDRPLPIARRQLLFGYLLANPGAHAADTIDGDTSDIARRHVRRRRAAIVGADQRSQARGSPLNNRGRTVDHQVELERWMDAALGPLLGLDRDHDTRVASKVAHLDVFSGVHHHQLVAVHSDPRTAHLRAAVGVDGHHMSQVARLHNRPGSRGKDGHRLDANSRRGAPNASRRQMAFEIFAEEIGCGALPTRASPPKSDRPQNRSRAGNTCERLGQRKGPTGSRVTAWTAGSPAVFVVSPRETMLRHGCSRMRRSCINAQAVRDRKRSARVWTWLDDRVSEGP